eukprot:9379571-Pyramimonas_sp.AAC.1
MSTASFRSAMILRLLLLSSRGAPHPAELIPQLPLEVAVPGSQVWKLKEDCASWFTLARWMRCISERTANL